MKPDPLSVRKAFHFAWRVYKEQFVLFTACLLTFFAEWVVVELIVIAGQRFGLLLWAVAHISFFIVFAGMEVGFMQMCLALHDGKQVRYADLFRELRFGAHFLFVQISYFSMVLVGLVLLILPGTYWGARYGFHAHAFAEGSRNLKQSFQQSAELSQDSIWFLFWFSIFVILMNVAGACLLGFGLLITIPLSMLMKVDIYRQLKK